ncbi:DUF3098 domain-containing protein [bacterium]|nr:DUF3098 domain-containing protein [bacterium]
MKRKSSEEKKLLPRIELGKPNLILFLVGVAILIIGFLLMSIGPWDNPLSRSVAPIVLLVGYLIVFPAAIFYRKSSDVDSPKSRPR